jgi:hypothetical protein
VHVATILQGTPDRSAATWPISGRLRTQQFKTLEGDNRHLATLEGRYLMEMERRALAAALPAVTPVARKGAIQDAVLFRRQRYLAFPSAASDGWSLESNEGVAEYTGVRSGLTKTEERCRYHATLRGPGLRLSLNPGWIISPGTRAGDLGRRLSGDTT